MCSIRMLDGRRLRRTNDVETASYDDIPFEVAGLPRDDSPATPIPVVESPWTPAPASQWPNTPMAGRLVPVHPPVLRSR